MVIVAKRKDIDPVIGRRIREIREGRSLTQAALAALTGVEPNSLARIERGEREPGWGTVVKLATALGVTPNDFLPLDDQPPETPEPEPPPAPKRQPRKK